MLEAKIVMPERSRIRRGSPRARARTRARARRAPGRAPPRCVTSRPSSCATLVNGVASRPQARKRANASRSQSTLSAKPWRATQLSTRMPSDAILRPSTQTPTCSRSSPATARDAELGERLDHDALEVVRVLAQVLAVVAQVEDRVADELAGAVPGRAPAAVGAQRPPSRARGRASSPPTSSASASDARPSVSVGGCSQRMIVSGTAHCERAAASSSCSAVDLGERRAARRAGRRRRRGAMTALAHPAVGFGSTGFGRSCAPVPVLSDGTCSGPVPR